MAEKAGEEKFSADAFIKSLLEEGTKRSCDETIGSFRDQSNLPEFYKEDVFRRGQKFFNDNIFALLFSKFLGLLSVLAIPSVIRMLMFTNKSGSPMAAYKRYLSTVFHMCIWYQNDFAPGSKLWRSLSEVKNKHNFVSKICCAEGLGRITQKDMAVTQFGFMGFAIINRKEVGLHDVDDEDLKAFVHVWRVVGYLLGLEDRYNICRDSLEETYQICKLMADDVLKPMIERKDKDFISMATYLSDGMWSMNPALNANIFLTIVHKLLQPNCEAHFMELNFFQNLLLQHIYFTIWSLQFTVVRYFYNCIQHLAFWLMRVCPFLAYYQFGVANSHVRMLQSDQPVIKL